MKITAEVARQTALSSSEELENIENAISKECKSGNFCLFLSRRINGHVVDELKNNGYYVVKDYSGTEISW